MKRSVASKLLETVLTGMGLGVLAVYGSIPAAIGVYLMIFGNNLKFTPRD